MSLSISSQKCFPFPSASAWAAAHTQNKKRIGLVSQRNSIGIYKRIHYICDDFTRSQSGTNARIHLVTIARTCVCGRETQKDHPLGGSCVLARERQRLEKKEKSVVSLRLALNSAGARMGHTCPNYYCLSHSPSRFFLSLSLCFLRLSSAPRAFPSIPLCSPSNYDTAHLLECGESSISASSRHIPAKRLYKISIYNTREREREGAGSVN